MKKSAFNKITPWIWPGFVLAVWALFIWNKMYCLLNSDLSSELLLGNILSKEQGFLSNKWIYSTELRVLNTQIIYKLVFAFSNNWRTVRCVSNILMILILLCCFYYLMLQLSCRKAFPFLAPLLIWNYSNEYFEFVSKGAYYIPHICISFLTIGMICQCIRSTKKSHKLLLVFFMSVLALLAGMGGPRQIIVLYLPLLCSSVPWFVLEKSDGNGLEKLSYLLACTVNFVFSIAGYVINSKILAQKFQFMVYDIHYKDFSLESVVQAFNGILRTFGYSGGKIFSFATVLNGCMFMVVLMVAVSVYTGITGKCRLSFFARSLSGYFLCAVIIYVLLYAFTDIPYADRYNLPILVFAIPVIAVHMKEVLWNQTVKRGICVFALGVVYLCGVRKVYTALNIDTTAPMREVVDYLLDRQVVNGYATFWNGNVMTELSNGEVAVRTTSCAEDIFRTDDNLYRWLQLKEHMEHKPEGNIFILLTQEEFAACPQELLAQEEAAFSNANYILYIFPGYDEFAKRLEGRT
ncbi:hypothetical protein C823_001884 [Eubacterium plexicaudatum ASF492]|nr:hypothetical protein C823_001884 [Eubacterium plexicaudatum ASF492]